MGMDVYGEFYAISSVRYDQIFLQGQKETFRCCRCLKEYDRSVNFCNDCGQKVSRLFEETTKETFAKFCNDKELDIDEIKQVAGWDSIGWGKIGFYGKEAIQGGTRDGKGGLYLGMLIDKGASHRSGGSYETTGITLDELKTASNSLRDFCNKMGFPNAEVRFYLITYVSI